MKQLTSKRIVVIGIIVAVVVMGGIAAHFIIKQSQASGPTAAVSGSEATAGKAHATPTSGAIHLSEYSNGDGTESSVIITGAIGDFGSSVSVYPNGAINLEHNSQANLALTQGSFRLDVAAFDKNIVQAFTSFKPNQNTCSGTISASGKVPIVPNSGTGAYRGISGSLDLTAMIDEVDKTCDGGKGAYLGQALITSGSGTVSFKQ